MRKWEIALKYGSISCTKQKIIMKKMYKYIITFRTEFVGERLSLEFMDEVLAHLNILGIYS